MPDPLTTILDIDLARQDIQDLHNANAVAAFFARLGYNTDVRTAQTAGNLGISADSTASRPIKKIELIADHEGLLQLYLFELQSITVAHTRALARAFRNRAGNYLLVLTTDYDRLDFVFLERESPKPTGGESSLGERQSVIRPRILTVERRNPTPIQLRVLRRLGILPISVAKTIAEMSRQIQKIEAKRVLKNRSERARLAPESQPIQDAIDAVLFRC